ncbi:MAG: prepilin peptidase [Comamonadaceae bacterium]|nr:MAG: prepilin peptidase [Comamonadaceae bacterium]
MTLALALWLVIVIVYDFRKRRVPNWLVLSGAALAMVSMATGLQPADIEWLDALAAGALAFTVMLGFYAAGWMGAGDVKFAGALGLWVGMQALLPVWVISSLLAALHGVLWMALNRWAVSPRLFMALSAPQKIGSGSTAGPMGDYVEHATQAPQKRQRHIPYAAYLAIAALVCMTWPLPPFQR